MASLGFYFEKKMHTEATRVAFLRGWRRYHRLVDMMSACMQRFNIQTWRTKFKREHQLTDLAILQV